MSVIYEPQGAALEYAELAANLYRGCSHACRFCYAPSVLRKSGTSVDSFRHDVQPRPDIIKQFARDCRKLAEAGCTKRVLLSFTTDPYQPAEREHRLTRQALQILNEHGRPWQVCTKNGLQAMEDDLPLFTAGGGRHGQTIVFTNDTDRQLWEPRASPIEDRLQALKIAHHVLSCGCRTRIRRRRPERLCRPSHPVCPSPPLTRTSRLAGGTRPIRPG